MRQWRSGRKGEVRGGRKNYTIEGLEGRVMLAVTPVVGPLPEYQGTTVSVFGSAPDLYLVLGSPREVVRSDGAGGIIPILSLPSDARVYNGEILDGKAYISFLSGGNSQLWVSDGTAAGTTKISDFSSTLLQLFDLNGNLIFKGGSNVWRSDGTQAGTVLLSSPTKGVPTNPTSLFNLNGTVYFGADGGLWKTDGTDAGTGIVSTAPYSMSWFAQLNGKLYFSSFGTGGYELWSSDGTAAGTGIVKDIYPGSGSSVPSWMANVDGALYFFATSPGTGTELWKSDGTSAGTVLVTDINPGDASSYPHEFKDLNGKVSFLAISPADSGNSAGLYVTDGTADGTVRLTTINGNADYDVAGGLAYFSADDPVAGQELWASDGTVAGTRLVADINPGIVGSAIGQIHAVGGKIYFTASDGLHGGEVWTSDGTSGGTVMVYHVDSTLVSTSAGLPVVSNGRTVFSDLVGGTWAVDVDGATPVRLTGAGPREMTASAGYIYFAVEDLGFTPMSVWRTDGTPGGTVALRRYPSDSPPKRLFAFGSDVYFAARESGTDSYSLWKSDGTVSGTAPLPGADGMPVYDPQSFARVGNTLYFYAYDSLGAGGHGYELWKTDGTSGGTVMVKDVVAGTGSAAVSGAPAGSVAALGGEALFVAATASGGEELWASDGTDAGTVQVTNFGATPGAAIQTDGTGNASVVVVNGVAYFMAHDAAGVQSLWRSDGTAGGTVAVTAVDPGDAYKVVDLTAVGSQLFFVDLHGGTHSEYDLWRSDGTAAGTVLLKKFLVDSSLSLPGIGTISGVNGVAYFAAWSKGDGTGDELWRSDGTATGTFLAADVIAGAGHSLPQSMQDGGNGTVLFSASPQAGAGGIYRYTPDAPNNVTVLTRDADGVHVDWSRGGVNGQMMVSDPAGLSLDSGSGAGGIVLNYTYGDPLPGVVKLKGSFTMYYLGGGASPLAGTTIDLGTGKLFVSYAAGQSPVAAIRAALVAGYNRGAWNGSSANGVITSSAAALNPSLFSVGYADNASDPAVNTTPNSIELVYTIGADANLDGQVSLADFSALSTGFGNGTRWTQGDFNYDQQVTLGDFGVLTNTFGQSLATAGGPAVAQAGTAGTGVNATTATARARVEGVVGSTAEAVNAGAGAGPLGDVIGGVKQRRHKQKV